MSDTTSTMDPEAGLDSQQEMHNQNEARLVRLIRRRRRMVAILGFPASGKTAYLYSLGVLLSSGQQSRRWTIEDSKSEILQIVRRMQDRAGNPWELTAALLPPMAVDLFSARRWGIRFDISSGDTSGEHYSAIADRHEGFGEEVFQYVQQLESEILPYCPAYLMMLDCSVSPKVAAEQSIDLRTIFNKIHGWGDTDSDAARKRRRLLRHDAPRPIAIVLTKSDLLAGKEVRANRGLSRYVRYLESQGIQLSQRGVRELPGGLISYTIKPEILLNTKDYPDGLEAEAIARDYINSHLPDLGDFVTWMEQRRTYEVRIFATSAWGYRSEREDGDADVIPHSTSIQPARIFDPLFWVLDRMYAKEWKRAGRRLVTWLAAAVVVLAVLMPGLFHGCLAMARSASAAGDPAEAYTMSSLARYNPYCAFLHWFDRGALWDFAQSQEELAQSLLAKGEFDRAARAHSRYCWVVGPSTQDWLADRMAKQFETLWDADRHDEAAKIGETYLQQVAVRDPAPDILGHVLEFHLQEYEKQLVQDAAEADVTAARSRLEGLMEWARGTAREQNWPRGYLGAVDSAACRADLMERERKHTPKLVESQNDETQVANVFREFYELDLRCGRTGDPALIQRSAKRLDQVASHYARLLRQRWQQSLDAARTAWQQGEPEKWREALGLLKMGESAVQPEFLNSDVKEVRQAGQALLRWPGVATVRQSLISDRGEMERLRTLLLLGLVARETDTASACKSLREALAYWQQNVPDARTAGDVRSIIVQQQAGYQGATFGELCSQLGGMKGMDSLVQDLRTLRANQAKVLAIEDVQKAFLGGRLAQVAALVDSLEKMDKDRFRDLCAAARQWRDLLNRESVYVPMGDGAGIYLAKYETTIGQYSRFLKSLPEGERQNRWPRLALAGVELAMPLEGEAPTPQSNLYLRTYQYAAASDVSNLPVSGVSYEDAAAYCEWLSLEQRASCRLPKATEWEQAAGKPYPWGSLTPEQIRGRKGDLRMQVVGQDEADRSSIGCYDMAFNVQELTDTLDRGRYILKGKSYATWTWDMPAEKVRSDDRSASLGRQTREQGVGFRVAWEPLCSAWKGQAHEIMVMSMKSAASGREGASGR